MQFRIRTEAITDNVNMTSDGLGTPERVRFGDYALGSFIGMLPMGFVNASLGRSSMHVASVQFAAA